MKTKPTLFFLQHELKEDIIPNRMTIFAYSTISHSPTKEITFLMKKKKKRSKEKMLFKKYKYLHVRKSKNLVLKYFFM